MAKTTKLLRVQDSPRVQELEAELQAYQAKLPALQGRQEAAAHALQYAQQATDELEIAVLAGRASDKQLAEGQGKLADCKREQAIAQHDLADVERYLQVLPAALEQVKQQALADVVSNLRAAYAEAVAELRARLLDAKAASDAVQRLHLQAAAEVPAMLHGVYGMAAMDLGDAGLVLHAAGLPNLSLYELSQHFPPNATRLDGWLKQAETLLAELPKMAEGDRERRRLHDSHEAQQAEVERKKEANYAAMLKRDLERYGLR